MTVLTFDIVLNFYCWVGFWYKKVFQLFEILVFLREELLQKNVGEIRLKIFLTSFNMTNRSKLVLSVLIIKCQPIFSVTILIPFGILLKTKIDVLGINSRNSSLRRQNHTPNQVLYS